MKYQSLFISLCLGSLLLISLIPGAYAAETYAFQWALPLVGGLRPYGVAYDSSGKIYATDPVDHSVWKFNPDGSVVTKWGSYGSGNEQFDEPFGIAVNRTGYVYVADTSNNRIQIFSSDGTYVTQWGGLGTGNGKLNEPHGIAISSSGLVYVADTNNNRVQVFTPRGGYSDQWGSRGTQDGISRIP